MPIARDVAQRARVALGRVSGLGASTLGIHGITCTTPQPAADIAKGFGVAFNVEVVLNMHPEFYPCQAAE
jgi:hypothetical protein